MKKIVLNIVIVLVMATMAHANLIDRGTDSLGNHLIYDTDLNITWYDYTKSTDNWSNQMSWVESLAVTMNDGRSFTDWRLPTSIDGPNEWKYDGTAVRGFNVTTSELGHLYYEELGNIARYAPDGSLQTGYGLVNKGPFSNLQNLTYYWSGTECELTTGVAFSFFLNDGVQEWSYEWGEFFALAVRDGDVAAPVPEPFTALFLVTGLIGLAGLRKKFSK